MAANLTQILNFKAKFSPKNLNYFECADNGGHMALSIKDRSYYLIISTSRNIPHIIINLVLLNIWRFLNKHFHKHSIIQPIIKGECSIFLKKLYYG